MAQAPSLIPVPPGITRLAVLVSGGLDSAILLADAVNQFPQVYPLYIRGGLSWEEVELGYLRRFWLAIKKPTLEPIQILDMPVSDLYGGHWSITGNNVPNAKSAAEAVFLPGRNVLILSKALVWCHLRGVMGLALGVMGSNPFADATPAFFAAFVDAVNQALGGSTRLILPYAGMTKSQVLARGQRMPLDLTFSCLQPVDGKHCGRCNKCAERRQAFAEAGITDPTIYRE